MMIALTGWGQDAVRRRINAAGFDEHLRNPVNLDALTEILTTARSH